MNYLEDLVEWSVEDLVWRCCGLEWSRSAWGVCFPLLRVFRGFSAVCKGYFFLLYINRGYWRWSVWLVPPAEMREREWEWKKPREGEMIPVMKAEAGECDSSAISLFHWKAWWVAHRHLPAIPPNLGRLSRPESASAFYLSDARGCGRLRERCVFNISVTVCDSITLNQRAQIPDRRIPDWEY